MAEVYILHLSDIHLGTNSDAHQHLNQLETDLRKELNICQLRYLVISGDIANNSTEQEYTAAIRLIWGLKERFEIEPARIIIVPGNHDLNWDQGREAYIFEYRCKLTEPLIEGEYIPAGDLGILFRDESLYKQRFALFSYFYKDVCGKLYPLDPAEQGILHLFSDDHILFLGLNSCWQIDHYWPKRTSINSDALASALDQMQGNQYDDWLKVAVWHHPVTGLEMMDDEFLGGLAIHKFKVCMHGHIHKPIEGYHKYDAYRGLYIIGAGTFGATTRQDSIPLQYNLLAFDPNAQNIIVKTRKKETTNSPWKADPRWGDANNPKPFYQIELNRTIPPPGYDITNQTRKGSRSIKPGDWSPK